MSNLFSVSFLVLIWKILCQNILVLVSMYFPELNCFVMKYFGAQILMMIQMTKLSASGDNFGGESRKEEVGIARRKRQIDAEEERGGGVTYDAGGK